MAENGKQEGESGVMTRLSKAGEDAVGKLMEELGKNERVTDALGRAMSAKGKVDERTRKTLGQVGLAAADEIKDLRGRLERLEKRLAALEKKPAGTTTTAAPKKSSATAKKTSSATRASAAKKSSGPTSGSAS